LKYLCCSATNAESKPTAARIFRMKTEEIIYRKWNYETRRIATHNNNNIVECHKLTKQSLLFATLTNAHTNSRHKLLHFNWSIFWITSLPFSILLLINSIRSQYFLK
jgi:hypothetical protein